MKTIGIIPARAGSKRVPDKNIRLLCGKPLIAYTIEAAMGSALLDRVLVTTDNREIADVAAAFGAETPFIRPSNLALDDTPDKPVLRHALDWLKREEGYVPDAVAILRPTAPFKSAVLIDTLITYLETSCADSVRTVTRAGGVHHPYWMYTKDENGRASAFVEGVEVTSYYQSQLLPPAYRLNGVVDVIKAGIILAASGTLYGADMRIYEIPEDISMDIDTFLDFDICEIMMNKRLQ